MSDATYLTRADAAAWFKARGLGHITVAVLGNLAHQRKGPSYIRVGRITYYRAEDLTAWLDAQPRQPGPAARGGGRAA